MTGPRRGVGELGEDGVVARIAAMLGASPEGETWTGDDAAVVRAPGDVLLLTTDMLVDGVDFELSWASPQDVGWKAVAVNASDVAAMGGEPSHALTALSLRRATEVELVDGLVEGMREAARRWGVALVGGDLSSSGELALTVAMVGAIDDGGPVLRSTARPGDVICVTGCLGGAAGGLAALTTGALDTTGPRAAALRRLARRQLRPGARVEEGHALRRAGVTSMIDVSDGLAVDLLRLMRASGTGCEIDRDAVPVDPDLAALGEGPGEDDVDGFELAMTGGEDLELLFTLAPGGVRPARTALEGVGTAMTEIGVVTTGACRVGEADLGEWRERGWDHLSAHPGGFPPR